jgi:hypothetical protein
MNEFQVIYRSPKERRIDHTKDFATRDAAIEFMARNLNSGRLTWGVKYRGKDLPHQGLLTMVYASQKLSDVHKELGNV